MSIVGSVSICELSAASPQLDAVPAPPLKSGSAGAQAMSPTAAMTGSPVVGSVAWAVPARPPSSASAASTARIHVRRLPPKTPGIYPPSRNVSSRGRLAGGTVGWKWKVVSVAVVVTAAVLAFAATVPAATNLLTNGTFEGSGSGSLSGWAASGGSLSLVTGNGGGHAARVSASTAGTQAYAYTPSKPVKNLVAGAAYTLDGTVRSATGGTVCLKLKEVPATGSTTVGSAQQCIAATSTWQAFPTVSYKAAKAGDSLT